MLRPVNRKYLSHAEDVFDIWINSMLYTEDAGRELRSDDGRLHQALIILFVSEHLINPFLCG